MALLDPAAYDVLGGFRCELRQVLGGAETKARHLGLPPQQHQILLILAAHEDGEPMSATRLAECLNLKIHTVSEIVSRMAEAGLLDKAEDPQDRRKIHLSLTELSRRHLEALSHSHAHELERLDQMARKMLDKLESRGLARAWTAEPA